MTPDATHKRQPLLGLLILLAALGAIAAGYAQVALGIGQTPAEFAADSDATLKVATWAFAIWGVIYLGLVIYAVYRLVAPGTAFLRRMAWPSLAAMIGIGTWIFAAAWDLEYLTIVLIVGSAASLIVPLMAAGPTLDGAEGRQRLLAAWPLGLLAGWLTIASAANILTVLTGNGQLPAFLSPTGWAIAAVVLVILIAVAMLRATRLFAYAIPIIWGLAGVFAAEQARNPTLAWTAAAAGAGLLLLAVINLRRP